MFEFQYEVALSITHSEANLGFITERLRMNPLEYSVAGEPLVGQSGISRGRNAKLSYWSTTMHAEALLNSDQLSLEDFLLSCVNLLSPHAEIFRKINGEGGEVQFRIGCHCEEAYSSSVLGWNLLQKCAEIGLGLEIDIIIPVTNNESESKK